MEKPDTPSSPSGSTALIRSPGTQLATVRGKVRTQKSSLVRVVEVVLEVEVVAVAAVGVLVAVVRKRHLVMLSSARVVAASSLARSPNMETREGLRSTSRLGEATLYLYTA